MTMDFGKTTKIESVALTADLPDLLYPVNDQDEQENVHKVILRDVVRFLGPKIGTFPKGYNLIVLKEAMDAFINYADDVYNKSRKEATGLHLGYYLHAPEDPDIKVGIATSFMEASGDASVVTCEISYDDSSLATQYGDDNHLVVIDWPHSHPGFGVFYSDTDSSTLTTTFNAEQHAGIVVDNLQNRFLAYKIIDGKQVQIPIWGFSLTDCRQSGELKLYQYLDVQALERKSMSMSKFNPLKKSDQEKNQCAKPEPELFPTKEECQDTDRLADIEERLERIEKALSEISAIMKKMTEKNSGNKRNTEEQRFCSIPVDCLIAFVALTFGFTLLMNCL